MVSPFVASVFPATSPLAIGLVVASAVGAGDDVNKLSMSITTPRGEAVATFSIGVLDFTASPCPAVDSAAQVGFVLALENYTAGSP
jgi:hypothetical protein